MADAIVLGLGRCVPGSTGSSIRLPLAILVSGMPPEYGGKSFVQLTETLHSRR